ncbi:DoxX family protein [Chryseobacterium sp. P1-3]|uniref:DoxX family protein n=1 Tax=Chryseobacterium sp. (strain P1-3) TaxID=1517683 RepID=UPI002934F935|nr:DoxX family protein [Chryseobacterium sp. P1-3]
MQHSTYTKIYLGGRIFMSLWFAASGFFELTRNPVVWNITLQLGYPPHFIYILGIFKIVGSIIFLIPHRFNRIKEWIFAGMFFDITFRFLLKDCSAWLTFYNRCDNRIYSPGHYILRV